MRRLAHRYALEDCVLEADRWSYWRGVDDTLHRPVGLVLLDADHPHRADVLRAARVAAGAEDHRLHRVLDVLDDDEGSCLVVEWLPGAALEELAAPGPLPDAEACAFVREAAWTLATADRQGLHHGALAPRWLLRTTDGRVRVIGLETVAALTQVPADRRCSAGDAAGLGALLYAALTGRWPGDRQDSELPAAPRAGGRPVRPRQVRAGVPTVLDDVVARAMALDARAQPLRSPEEVARALEAAARALPEDGREPSERPGPPRDPGQPEPSRRNWPAAAALAVAVLLLVAVSVAVLAALRERGPADQRRAAPSASASATASAVAPGSVLGVVSARDFDPDGNGSENPEQVPQAVDGSAGTAWRTLSYSRADLGGLKPGVGLLLDLGAVEQVGAVRADLVGRGTSIELRAGTSPGTQAEDFITVASARGVGDQVMLRVDPPVQARYLLLWLTALPREGTGYRGGVSDVAVFRG